MRFELSATFMKQLAAFERGTDEERAIARELREKLALIRQVVEGASTPEEVEVSARRVGIELEDD